MLKSDVTVIYDDAQFKRQSWQHRYLIPDRQGKIRLMTLPVKHIDLYNPINKVRIFDGNYRWRDKMLKTIGMIYRDQPYDIYWLMIKKILDNKKLFDAQMDFITWVKNLLGIETELCLSSGLDIVGGGTQKLVEICKHFNADEYLCGGTAFNSYMEHDLFKEAGIETRVQRWNCRYHPYGNISLLDALMRYGYEARRWIK